jgi:hypothetical protein
MTVRERLPQRRASLTFNLEHMGLHYTNVRFVPIAQVRSVYSISLFARATPTVSLYIVGTTTSPVAYEAAFPWAVLSVPPVDQ